MDVNKLIAWLKTYPNWGGGDILPDYLDAEPGSAALYQKGLQEVKRVEDVLGNVAVHCRYRFLLRRMVRDGDMWLPDFQQWVQKQCALGLTPTFGDVPANERLQAENGKLLERSQPGTGVYEVTLVADFIKNYEEKNHGEN